MALMAHNVDHLAARSDQDHLNKIEQTKLVAGDLLKCKSCNVDAQTEIESKAYSHTEFATNNATRENMQSDIDELAATVGKHIAESTQLGEELAGLDEEKEAAESYYLHSMRPAAEGSGDYNGLSEYPDDEEKQTGMRVSGFCDDAKP
jgi:hypothetical protein